MGNNILVLTPTYNRPENIMKLFSTLQEQNNKNFHWMIIDDGSSKSYNEVICDIKDKADFNVEYYHKENGGKSSSINYALDRMTDKDFVLIIDDDEYLYPNAIEIVSRYVARYFDSKIGVIHFNRADMRGHAIANPIIEEDFIMSIQAHVSHKYHTDGYVGYFLKKVGKIRFPIFYKEKYIGPSVLMMLVSEKSDLLWTCEILGYTEYLVGGLSDTGRPLRIKSPMGMAARALLMQDKESGYQIRTIYAIQYFAYLFIAGEKNVILKTTKNYRLFIPALTKPLGWLLYRYWKRKYRI